MSEQPQDLGAVAKQVILAVGPARIAAWALSAGAGADPARGDRAALAARRLADAEAMLSGGARALFAACGEETPATLDALRRDALAALGRLKGAAEGGPAPAADAEAVDRAVSAYLDELDRHADARDAERRRRDRARVGEAVAEIRAIAASITLVSVNAAIEAARAGEAGLGFGSIAAEIRALSTQSQRALDAIAARVGR